MTLYGIPIEFYDDSYDFEWPPTQQQTADARMRWYWARDYDPDKLSWITGYLPS